MTSVRVNMDWVFNLRQMIPAFLDRLKATRPGFFHFSLSGDLYGEKVHWGLDNTVHAIHIYHTLGILDGLPEEEKSTMTHFIKSFERSDGTFCDPLIKRKSFWRRRLSAAKNMSLNSHTSNQLITTQTRNALVALRLLRAKAETHYVHFLHTRQEIDRYLDKLNWRKPWSAGSHYARLVAFLQNVDLRNKEDLVSYAVSWVDKLQNPNDGSWYRGSPSLQQRINGAMKVLTGFQNGGRSDFRYADKLIDLCLFGVNDHHACDNFDTMYAIYHAKLATNVDYRKDEITRVAIGSLEKSRKCYFPEIGGFSSVEGRAGTVYYGAKINKGLNEPDIHGTRIFLHGISVIAQLLDIRGELGFNEFVP